MEETILILGTLVFSNNSLFSPTLQRRLTVSIVTYERNDPAMDDMHDRDMSRRSLPSSAGGRMHDTAFSREYEQESNYGRNRPGHSMNVSASQSMPWNQIEGVSPFLKGRAGYSRKSRPYWQRIMTRMTGLGGYSSTSRSFSHRPSFAGTSDRRRYARRQMNDPRTECFNLTQAAVDLEVLLLVYRYIVDVSVVQAQFRQLPSFALLLPL